MMTSLPFLFLKIDIARRIFYAYSVKRSKRSDSESVIARVEKDFCSRMSNSLPGVRIASSSQGRETSPPESSADPFADLFEWFGPQPIGQRKRARPFRAGARMEVVLRSNLERSQWSFLRPENRSRIRKLLFREAERSSIHLAKIRLEAAGTLRLELETGRREDLARFLRILAGRIPRVVAGAERGRPISSAGRVRGQRSFWSGLAESRCVRRAAD